MRKIMLTALLGITVTSLTGCATHVFERHTAGKNDPFSQPGVHHHAFVSSPDLTVLGPVTAEAESTVLVGLVARGNEGYGLLMRSAKAAYGDDAHSITYLTADYEYEGILYPIIGTVTTTYHGVAVKVEDINPVESADF